MSRFKGLDFLKFLCAFMVICIHIPFPGLLDTLITPITRIAVPVFFMITGYFYTSTCERNKQTKQLSKLFRLFIGANILYFIWSVVKTWLSHESLSAFMTQAFSMKSLLKFIMLNDSPFGSHLWYLGAIVYVLLIVFLFEKRCSRKKLYPAIPILLVVDLVFGKYSLLLLGRSVPYVLVRNFLFVGLPYFLIGDILYQAKPQIKTRNLIILSFIFVCTTWLERGVLGMMDMNATRDHYISTTFLAVTAFLLALRTGNACTQKWHKAICFIGSKLSLNIYVLHPILILVFRKFRAILANRSAALTNICDYAAPFLILMAATLISWGIYAFNQSIKERNASRRHAS